MAETVEKLTTGEPLTIDQLIEYLPALKEIPRAQSAAGIGFLPCAWTCPSSSARVAVPT